MSNQKISDMPAGGTLTGAENLAMIQDGTNIAPTLSTVAAFVSDANSLVVIGGSVTVDPTTSLTFPSKSVTNLGGDAAKVVLLSKINQGTVVVEPVATLTIAGSGATLADSGSGVATLTIPASSLVVTKGTASVTSTASLVAAGTGITVSGSAGVATLTVPSLSLTQGGTFTLDPTTSLKIVGGAVVSGSAGAGTITVNSGITHTAIGNGGTVANVGTLNGGTNIAVSSGGAGIANLAVVGIGIAGLPGANPLDGTELVYIVQGGTDVQTTTGGIAGIVNQVITQPWIGINVNNAVIHECMESGTVVGIWGNAEILNGAAYTVQPVKVGNGTAVASGVNLTTSTFDANASAFTNQTLTLSGTPANLVFTKGDRIGLKATGTASATVVAMMSLELKIP